jgi:hypothetical protein
MSKMTFRLIRVNAFALSLIKLTNSCGESGGKIEKEYDKTSKQLDSISIYLTQLQESKNKRQILQDSIDFYRADYDSIRKAFAKKIHVADSIYLVDIQRIKDDHYSKYGDDFNSQSILDKAIDHARAKKDNLTSSYKAIIKEAEDKVKGNLRYQKFKEELASLPKYSPEKEEKALEKQKELYSKITDLKGKLSKK